MTLERSSVRQHGFTILEMLMVIVTIGILASIAYPRYLEARDRGHVGAAQYDVVHVRAALAIYAADHGAYPEALSSYQDLKDVAVDRQGMPYMILPSGATFRWVVYGLRSDGNYVLKIQALDNRGTVLTYTGDGPLP